MKLDLDRFHTEVVEKALIEYAKHVNAYEQKRAATDILGMIAFAKRV